jgi:hypothetical protein
MPGEDELQALADDIRERGQNQPVMPRRASSLFHPRRILKLGNGWVWMDRATVTDLLEWGRQSTKNVTRVKTADADRQSYVAERVDAFRSHHGLVLLGELERIVFGYVNDPNEPADIEPEAEKPARPPNQPRAVVHYRIGEPQ